MPRRKKQSNPSNFVTREECARVTSSIRDELRMIRIALVGEDMRGGLVKDVADLKKERSTTVEIVKAVVVPIIVAVITAVVMSLIH